LARRRSNVVYNTIPKSREWLIVNYASNVAKGILLGFYIFKGEKLRDDHIRLCKPNTYMAMQKKETWMIISLFKEFLSFFNKSILGGMSFSNQHLLILNGHSNNVTLQAIE
jgi:hypothetical protein